MSAPINKSDLYNKVINEIAVIVKRNIDKVDEAFSTSAENHLDSKLDYIPLSEQSFDEDGKISCILSETYGAYSIPDADNAIGDFINTITTSFFIDKNFLKYEVSSPEECTKKFGADYFRLFPKQFPYEKKVFANTFEPNNIPWLKELTIVLAPNPLTSEMAIADPKNHKFNIYSDDCIEHSTVVFLNIVSDIVIIEHKIYHELRHIYSEFINHKFEKEFDEFQKVNGKLPNKSEALNWVLKRICYKLSNNVDLYFFNYQDKDINYKDTSSFSQFSNNSQKLRRLLFSILYFCNPEEISAHLEEISSEIRSHFRNASPDNRNESLLSISETYNKYNNIYNVLEYLYTNVPRNIWKEPIKEISDTLLEVFNDIRELRKKYTDNLAAEHYFSEQEQLVRDSQKIICNYKHLIAEMRKNVKHMLSQARKQFTYFSNNKDENYLP